MNGCVLKASVPAKPLSFADMRDGQIAQTASGQIVQCFDSTEYGANKKHWVVLGCLSGRSYSVPKGHASPDIKIVRILEKGDTIVID